MIGPGQSIPGFHNVPDSLNPIVGTLIGDVTDVQEWQDGNILQLEEIAGTPGMELELLFTGVKSIRRIGVGMYYAGSLTHWVEIQIWDYVGGVWRDLWTFTSGNDMNYRYSDLPNRGQDFIDAGNAKLRVYHPTGGSAAHDAFIDYAALIT